MKFAFLAFFFLTANLLAAQTLQVSGEFSSSVDSLKTEFNSNSTASDTPTTSSSNTQKSVVKKPKEVALPSKKITIAPAKKVSISKKSFSLKVVQTYAEVQQYSISHQLLKDEYEDKALTKKEVTKRAQLLGSNKVLTMKQYGVYYFYSFKD